MAFNLSTAKLALKETFDLQLRHPVTDELLTTEVDGKSVPVGIRVFGTASKEYRQASTAMSNRHLKRDKKKVTAELLREEGVELLVACSDSGINLEYEGAPLDTPDAFRALYSNPEFSWIKDQVDAALGDVSNFLEQ